MNQDDDFIFECKEELYSENEDEDQLIEEASLINPLANVGNDSFNSQENRLKMIQENEALLYKLNRHLTSQENMKVNPLSNQDERYPYDDSNSNEGRPPLPLECILLEERQTSFPCEQCDKVFKYKKGMREHMRRIHTDRTIVECTICKAKICNFSMTRHVRTQHMKTAFECKKCSRNFSKQEILDRHMSSKHKKHYCLFCTKVFPDNRKLTSHMRIYHELRPYPCPACNRFFTTKQGMHQHLLLHTGKRPYTCDICGDTFIQKSNLNFHRKIHPGPLPPIQPTSVKHIIKKFTQYFEYKRRKQEKEKKIKENTEMAIDGNKYQKEAIDRKEQEKKDKESENIKITGTDFSATNVENEENTSNIKIREKTEENKIFINHSEIENEDLRVTVKKEI